MLEFIKNKEILEPLTKSPHAFVTYRICNKTHPKELIEEIAIGQSLGAWEPAHASLSDLRNKVAKVVEFRSDEDYHWGTVAYPGSLWHGELSWLVTQIFGKMSFYSNVQLHNVTFSKDCSQLGAFSGPVHSMDSLRERCGAAKNTPLLMGILKPNVAMSDVVVASLYEQAAEAGAHLVKDDEIRHDDSFVQTLGRVEAVANIAAKKNLNTVYAVHLAPRQGIDHASVRRFENAGAHAFLMCPWTSGLNVLQQLRTFTKLPLLAHPSLAGAFGFEGRSARIHPRVTLAQLVRAAGADLTLFPSPYGKLGLTSEDALAVAKACSEPNGSLLPTVAVPSAGIKPEHAPKAKADFGNNFVLNAGTAIFSGNQTPRENIAAFRKALYEG